MDYQKIINLEDSNGYVAFVDSIYDGDTITCTVYLGLSMKATDQKIRLYGIDTPELRGDEKEAGKEARDYLRGLILNKKITLNTVKNDKRDKYGRLLGIIEYQGDIINQDLLDKGYAELYDR